MLPHEGASRRKLLFVPARAFRLRALAVLAGVVAIHLAQPDSPLLLPALLPGSLWARLATALAICATIHLLRALVCDGLAPMTSLCNVLFLDERM
jgi:hypothetical protein